MKSKASLTLIEQTIMIMVFALAATLCIQAFVFSNNLSMKNEARDRALLEAQTVAEAVKGCSGDYERASQICGGDVDSGVFKKMFDGQWVETEDEGNAVFKIEVSVPQEDGLTGMAEVTATEHKVSDGTEALLCTLKLAWQEGENGDE